MRDVNMFPAQLAKIDPDKFSRCEELQQKTDHEKSLSPGQKKDAAIKESINHALWKDDVLRAIEYNEFAVYVKNGVVYLNGHIVSASSRGRIEKAIRVIPGIQALQNNLVLDDKLTLEVAGSLGKLEHTYGCKFFTGASHGVVSLGGIVSDDNVKLLAEKCVASNPNVRAVINNVRVSGTQTELQDLPFLQPVMGETIYFLDGVSGVVKRVIINPNNRRVIAMILLMNFSDPRLMSTSLTDGKTRLPVLLVNVPVDTVRYLTKDSGFLLINSNDRSRYQDFDPASFFAPGADWTPPYPYCPQDVLFPVENRKADALTADTPHPFAIEELLEGAPYQERLFATDNLSS